MTLLDSWHFGSSRSLALLLHPPPPENPKTSILWLHWQQGKCNLRKSMPQFCSDFRRSENIFMDPRRACQPCRRLPGIEDGGGGWREEGETQPPVKSAHGNLTGSLEQALWSPKNYPSLDQMHEPTNSCSFQSDHGAQRVV